MWKPYDEFPEDAGAWITPPSCQGQIVTRSYAADEDGYIYRRTHDASDGTHYFEIRKLGDDEAFEPWNTEPA